MADTQPEPTLNTQAGCAESAKVRSWLAEHGIPFTERDASADPEAAAALAATGTFATPLLVNGERMVLGFRPKSLTRALQFDRLAATEQNVEPSRRRPTS
jgi:arsenate reductase-like glutaredoxin family protein